MTNFTSSIVSRIFGAMHNYEWRTGNRPQTLILGIAAWYELRESQEFALQLACGLTSDLSHLEPPRFNGLEVVLLQEDSLRVFVA